MRFINLRFQFHVVLCIRRILFCRMVGLIFPFAAGNQPQAAILNIRIIQGREKGVGAVRVKFPVAVVLMPAEGLEYLPRIFKTSVGLSPL